MEAILAKFVVDVRLYLVVAAIVGNVILGVVAAIKRGDFSFVKIADFFKEYVLYMVVPWFVVYAMGVAAGEPFVEWAANVGIIVIGAILLRVYANLSELIPGLPKFEYRLRK